MTEEHARLQQLLETDQLKLGVHVRRMNSPGSIVFNMWENVWPPALVLVASVACTRFIGTWLGVLVLVPGLWWWLGYVQPRIRREVFERTAAYAMRGDAEMDALWRAGVLTLYARQPDGTEYAATPRDDWRAFVRALPEA